jgi:hypothetical protein
MRIGPLSILTGDKSWRSCHLAGWHSRHSLTWRWSIWWTLALKPSVRPHFLASKRGRHIFFHIGLGGLLAASFARHNTGGEVSFSLLFSRLVVPWQHPMWYRDIYMRERDRELNEDFRSQPAPAPNYPQPTSIQ